MASTLRGHGLKVWECEGENLDSLYPAMCESMNTEGPTAVVIKRKMAPGLKGLEGSTHAHDVVKV